MLWDFLMHGFTAAGFDGVLWITLLLVAAGCFDKSLLWFQTVCSEAVPGAQVTER